MTTRSLGSRLLRDVLPGDVFSLTIDPTARYTATKPPSTGAQVGVVTVPVTMQSQLFDLYGNLHTVVNVVAHDHTINHHTGEPCRGKVAAQVLADVVALYGAQMDPQTRQRALDALAPFAGKLAPTPAVVA